MSGPARCCSPPPGWWRRPRRRSRSRSSDILLDPQLGAAFRAGFVLANVAGGAYTWWRRPASGFGPLFAATGLLFALTSLTRSPIPDLHARARRLRGGDARARLRVRRLPGARLASRRERRWVGGLACVYAVVWAFVLALTVELPPAGRSRTVATRARRTPCASSTAPAARAACWAASPTRSRSPRSSVSSAYCWPGCGSPTGRPAHARAPVRGDERAARRDGGVHVRAAGARRARRRPQRRGRADGARPARRDPRRSGARPPFHGAPARDARGRRRRGAGHRGRRRGARRRGARRPVADARALGRGPRRPSRHPRRARRGGRAGSGGSS